MQHLLQCQGQLDESGQVKETSRRSGNWLGQAWLWTANNLSTKYPIPANMWCAQNRFRTKEGQEGARFKELTTKLEQLSKQLEESQQKLSFDEQYLQQVRVARL